MTAPAEGALYHESSKVQALARLEVVFENIPLKPSFVLRKTTGRLPKLPHRPQENSVIASLIFEEKETTRNKHSSLRKGH